MGDCYLYSPRYKLFLKIIAIATTTTNLLRTYCVSNVAYVPKFYFMWSSQYVLELVIIFLLEAGKLMLGKGKYLLRVTQWVSGGLKNGVLTDYKSLFFACHYFTYSFYNWNLINAQMSTPLDCCIWDSKWHPNLIPWESSSTAIHWAPL